MIITKKRNNGQLSDLTNQSVKSDFAYINNKKHDFC